MTELVEQHDRSAPQRHREQRTVYTQYSPQPTVGQLPTWTALDCQALDTVTTFGAAAAIYRAAGIPVFPVKPDKKPYTEHGFLDATTDDAQLTAWACEYPRAGVGIPTGEAWGVFVLVVEPAHGGDYDHINARFNLPLTLTSETGGGGQHMLFAHPGWPVSNNQNDRNGRRMGIGYDIRGDGGYIVAPPSLHKSGRRYQWLFTRELAPAPESLLSLLRPIERPQALHAGAPVATGEDAGRYWLKYYLPEAREGNRNNSGFLLALQLRDAGLRAIDAEAYMLEYTASAPGRDYSDREALATLRSVYSRPARERARGRVLTLVTPHTDVTQVDPGAAASDDAPGDGGRGPSLPGSSGKTHSLTELGNSERIIDRYRDRVRYCYLWGKWLAWDGRRWATDSAGRMTRFAKATVRAIYGEAEAETDDKRRAEIVKHALRSESDKAIRAALSLAQSEVPIQPDDLDSEASDWLLNCHNGTLDLRTGDLHPHRADLHITKLALAAYDPAAECPTWLAFLSDIMAGNEALITFLQRAIGYSLTGSAREQCFFLPYGTGQNGKSTLLEVLAYILADYAMHARPETFMVKRGDPIPNDIARLKGARFVSTTETEEGQRMAEALMKRITGGEGITGRFMRSEEFTFRSTLKLWLATNHKPVIRGTDMAIWRRVRLIPFTVTIERPDKELPEKLKAEAAGILAWAVRGCLDWQRDGLACPPEVQAATDAYRGEMDVVSAFIGECCAIGIKRRVGINQLYSAYKAWCEQASERATSKRDFSTRLKERDIPDFDEYRTNKERFWVGIGLLEESE